MYQVVDVRKMASLSIPSRRISGFRCDSCVLDADIMGKAKINNNDQHKSHPQHNVLIASIGVSFRDPSERLIASQFFTKYSNGYVKSLNWSDPFFRGPFELYFKSCLMWVNSILFTCTKFTTTPAFTMTMTTIKLIYVQQDTELMVMMWWSKG